MTDLSDVLVAATNYGNARYADGQASMYPTDTLDRAIYDMYGPPLRDDSTSLGAHEGSLAGVVPTSFNWYKGARRGVIGPYPADGYVSANQSPTTLWCAHNAWNALLPLGGVQHTVTNVRVHYAQLEICHLNVATNAWSIIRQDEATMAKKNMTGGFYRPSPFKKTADLKSAYRKESSGWSIDVSSMLDSTGNVAPTRSVLHTFWPDLFPRIQIGDGHTKGTHQIAIRLKARLISDDPSVDISAAQFMGHTSGDMFRDPQSGTDPSGVNPPFALPRLKKLTADWQYFGHVTGAQTDIEAYPPIPFLR